MADAAAPQAFPRWVAAMLVVWIAAGVVRGAWRRSGEWKGAAMRRAWSEPLQDRVTRTLGHPPDVVAAIRAELPPGGTVIQFSRLPGDLGELLRRRYRGRLKNYLYPDPEHIVFADSDDAGRAQWESSASAGAVVLEYGPFPATAPGRAKKPPFQTPAPLELALDSPLMRLWRGAAK